MSGTKVYVGNIAPGTNEREIEDEFARFGRLYKIWIARKPPGFAFIDYEDYRDAEDAVRKLDGYRGWRVEISRSRGPPPRGAGPRGGRGDMACFVCGEVGHMARDCRGAPPARGYSPARRRSPSPARGRSVSPRRRSPSPPPRGRSRSRSPYAARRSRSRS